MTLSRPASRIVVYIDDMLVSDAHVIQIANRVGSVGPSSAVIVIKDTLQQQSQLQNTSVKSFYTPGAIVRIERLETVDEEDLNYILFIGMVVGARINLSARGEEVEMLARVDPAMFGRKTTLDNAVALLETDKVGDDWKNYTPSDQDHVAVMNPKYRDFATPNMWYGGSALGEDPSETPLDPALSSYFTSFVDLGSVRRDVIESDRKACEESPPVAVDVAQFWTLECAVWYLCQLLNPDETYIQNPSREELLALPYHDDQSLIRNFEIKPNEHLTDVLTDLLRPLGFDWRIDYYFEEVEEELVPRAGLVVFRPASSETKTVQLQAWGSSLDTDDSEVEGLALTHDAMSSVGKVTILGSFQRHELTVELRPAWDSTYDSYIDDEDTVVDLKYDAPAWKTTPALRDVWRKFAANEGGDYTGTRDWFAAAANLGTITGWLYSFEQTKRRKPLPMLATSEDGEPLGETHPGVCVEYYDNTTEAWLPLESEAGNIRANVMEDELALYLTNTEVPVEIARQAQGESGFDLSLVKLRLTCTVEADVVFQLSEEDANPIAGVKIEEVVDRSNSYVFAKLTTGSVFSGADFDRASDPTDLMEEAAEKTLEATRGSVISGTITLEGCDRAVGDYLGKRLSKIAGRELDLATYVDTTQYPLITEITYHPQSERIVLSLDTTRT